MGKRKIDIARIEKPQARMVTFSKRRKGLFGKAEKFSKDFGLDVSVIVYSPAGNPFTFGPVDTVVDRILGNGCEGSDNEEERKRHWWLEFMDIKKQESNCNDLEGLRYLRSKIETLRDEVREQMNDASTSSASSSFNAFTNDSNTSVEAVHSLRADSAAASIDFDDGDGQRLEDYCTSVSNVEDFSGVAVNGKSKEDDGPLLLPYVERDSNFDVSEFLTNDTEEKNQDVINEIDFSDLDFYFGSDFEFDCF